MNSLRCIFSSIVVVLLLIEPTIGLKNDEDKQFETITDEEAHNFLVKFGYTIPAKLIIDEVGKVADVSNPLEKALKQFQARMKLPQTGQLDEETRKKMALPRCGMKDFLNPTKKTFKWKKADATYMFKNLSPDLPEEMIKQAVQQAFDAWSSVAPLTFTEVVGPKADIEIKFVAGDHGDESPFDGKGKTLAHANIDGTLHFDEDENWVYSDPAKIKKSKEYTDLLNVATHEIGHILGLQHSNTSEAIMFGMYEIEVDRHGRYIYPSLLQDDIDRVQAIYGAKMIESQVVDMSQSDNTGMPAKIEVESAHKADFDNEKGKTTEDIESAVKRLQGIVPIVRQQLDKKTAEQWRDRSQQRSTPPAAAAAGVVSSRSMGTSKTTAAAAAARRGPQAVLAEKKTKKQNRRLLQTMFARWSKNSRSGNE